jgi:hypothetical protein
MFFVYMEYYAGIPPSSLLLCFNKWDEGYLGKSLDELNEALYTGKINILIEDLKSSSFYRP